MLQQIQTKYMIALRQGTELRPEDLGSVRMAMRMAMEELHLQYRHDLADMDDIIADLLEQRDQLKAAAGMDGAEILRLQTMEDRLIAWVHEHAPEMADALVQTDTAAVIVDLLSKRGGATAAPPRTIPVETFVLSSNGNSNGHVQVTDLGTRYSGRRLNIDNDQVRTLAIAKIQALAAQLGRTPTQNDWNKNLGPDEPSLSSVKNRLGQSWNELVKAAGLTPNQSTITRQATAHEEEAPADNASSNFRSQ